MNRFDSAHHPEECGHCQACRHWQAEDEAAPAAAAGLCLHPELTHFSLQVTALCGCNRYAAVPAEDAALA